MSKAKEQSSVVEKVNHPPHYKPGVYEVIIVIEAHNLGFHIGNVVKYVLRAGSKPGEWELEDLKKAQWYLNRRIEQLEQLEKIGKEQENTVNETTSR
jgi:hypothetical protein